MPCDKHMTAFYMSKKLKRKEKGFFSYCHISQRFATNWTNVVTASVCLMQLKKGGFSINSDMYIVTSSKSNTRKKEKKLKKNQIKGTWKQAECMKWPQGRARTTALDENMSSQQIGQFVSNPFSRHLWSANFIARQQLHVMQ